MSRLPWLVSVLLHLLVLVSLTMLTRTPAPLPPPLQLNFQLVPEAWSPGADDLPSQSTIAPVDVPSKTKHEPLVKDAPVQAMVTESEPIAPEPTVPEVQKVIRPETPEKQFEVVEERVVEQTPEKQIEVVEERVEHPPAGTSPVAAEPLAPAFSPPPATAVAGAGSDRKTADASGHRKLVGQVRTQVLGQLNYPSLARRKGWCGELVLGFILCRDGSIENLRIVNSSAYGILDRAALQAVKASLPFEAGYERTEVRLPISFELE